MIGLAAAALATYAMWRVRRAYAEASSRSARVGPTCSAARPARTSPSDAPAPIGPPPPWPWRWPTVLGCAASPRSCSAASRHPTRRRRWCRRARRGSGGASDRAPVARTGPGVLGIRRDPRTTERHRPRGPTRCPRGARRPPRGPSSSQSLAVRFDGLVRAQAAAILLEDASAANSTASGSGGVGGDAEAEAVLVRLARSPHADARVAAHRALAASRSPEAVDPPGPRSRTRRIGTRPGGAHDGRRDPIEGVDELLAIVGGSGEVDGGRRGAMPVRRRARPPRSGTSRRSRPPGRWRADGSATRSTERGTPG